MADAVSRFLIVSWFLSFAVSEFNATLSVSRREGFYGCAVSMANAVYRFEVV